MLHPPGRRSAGLFAVAAILVAAIVAAPLATAEEGGEKKILLIGHELDHAWGTHMYLPTCELLAKCLRQTPRVEAVVSDGWPKDKAELAGVDAIVLYSSPGGELLLDGEQAAEVNRLLKQGVGLVCIHWATGLKKENQKRLGKQWMGMLGGMWLHFVGLKIDDSNLKQLDPQHPICNGWEEYELNDEFYLNTQVAPGAETLLEVEVDGKRVPVAWTYERPVSAGGRSFGTTLGHFHRNFGIEAFRKLMVGGILWAAHVPLPAGGPPVAVSQEDLKLPPEPGSNGAKKD
jgi:type 1 glutamine amidotransferase